MLNADAAGPRVQGALVHAIEPVPFDFSKLVPVTEVGSIHYIGRQLGQIVHWPVESIPEHWSPTWVVAAKRRGHLVFCGTDIGASEPVRGACPDRKKARKWRDFVGGHCKKLVPPAHPRLRALWKKYQEFARNV
jgi:hypothetical protein